MAYVRELNTMALQGFMDPTEWCIFKERVKEVSSNIPEIIGVLATGSLIQSIKAPNDYYENRRLNPMGAMYESIRNPERRKIFPGNKSDLDLWLCTQDTLMSSAGESIVDSSGIMLLEELVSGTVTRPSQQWCRKKEGAFSDYYKKSELYNHYSDNLDPNGEPWMASRFKGMLEREMLDKLPDFIERIGQFTLKTIPGDFLEIRAFPESLFHLRPDDLKLSEHFTDRQPFPRIADNQWIGPNHKSAILYNTGEATIYPFSCDGRILGQTIEDYIIEDAECFQTDRSYGALLIKPDAVQSNQIGIIKQKIINGLAPYEGCIILEKCFHGLSPLQVKQIYPHLSERDLHDATMYLASGESLLLAVKANLSQLDMLAKLSEIKGPRIADRNEERLVEGRITNGSIRDLLPLPEPEDETKYKALIETIRHRKIDLTHEFTQEEYAYYSRNLVHSPDNTLELTGILDLIGITL